MRAGLVTAPRRFELVEVAEPEPQPGWVVVDVLRCGVCGTDVHGFLGPRPYNPAICGHEWVGSVRTLGDGVTTLRPGERVIGAVPAPCEECAECLAGRQSQCSTAFAAMIGVGPLATAHGAFAPRLAIPASRLVPVPAVVPDDAAAQIEPLTVTLHAVNRTPPRPDDHVVVLGCGPIGLLALQVARAFGCGRVTVVEPLAQRREMALALGADDAHAPGADALRGISADLVLECAGVPATVQGAVDLVRRNGVVNLVGMATESATVMPSSWLLKEVTVVASLGYLRDEFDEAIDLLADQAVQVLPLHDRTIPLADLPAEIARLGDDPSSALKVLVDPRES